MSHGNYLALSRSVIHASLLAYAMDTFIQSQPLLFDHDNMSRDAKKKEESSAFIVASLSSEWEVKLVGG